MVLNTPTINGFYTRVKAYVQDTFDHVGFGSLNQVPVQGDTTFESLVIVKDREEFNNLSQSVIVSGYLTATEGNGTTFAQVGFTNGSYGTLQSLFATTSFEKTSLKQLWVDEEVKFTITQA